VEPVTPLRQPRLADLVADHIRDAILGGDLENGDRLPPVDTLLEQFGVSAPSMREALRVLEAEGLIEVQRGGIGGAVIQHPTARNAAYTLAVVLRGQGTTKRDVSSAFALLQPLCAQLCAERRDRQRAVVPELRALNEAAAGLLDTDPVAFNDAMLAYHRAVVRLGGNATLSVVTSALEHVWLADLRARVTVRAAQGDYPPVEVRRHELDRHERMTELIATGNGTAAAAAMAEHLAESADQKVFDADEVVDPKVVRLSPLID